MLDKSIAMYEKAVTLSPNAAHLWNERGNAFAADGQNDQALASYEKSLSIDKLFDQTYLLLADFLERTGQTDKLVAMLKQGIDMFDSWPMPGRRRSCSAISAWRRRGSGDLEGGRRRQPADAGADARQRRRHAQPGRSSRATRASRTRRWTGSNQAHCRQRGQDAAELKTLYQLAAELYQAQGDTATRSWPNTRRSARSIPATPPCCRRSAGCTRRSRTTPRWSRSPRR